MIHIGTSGYSYSYWKNRFYPEGLPSSQWLEYYATQFDSVEINNTFYRIPKPETLKKWADKTPENFLFSVKANKTITHIKKMSDAEDLIADFMKIIEEGLGEKLGCILYQMPPSYHFSAERLNDILQLSFDPRNVVEFRHISWWEDKVFEAFRKHKINFCCVSYPNLPDENIVTGKLLYRRMHGVPELFKSSYSEKELIELSENLKTEKEGFVFFNNTMFEAGYSNALQLKQLLEM